MGTIQNHTDKQQAYLDINEDPATWIQKCIKNGKYDHLIHLLESLQNQSLNLESRMAIQAALNLCAVCLQRQSELDAIWSAYQLAESQGKLLNDSLIELATEVLSSTDTYSSSTKIIQKQNDKTSHFTTQHLWQRVQDFFKPPIKPEALEVNSNSESLLVNAQQPEPIIGNDINQQERPLLEVYCFGKFRIYIGGKEVDEWTGNKGKSILKYLFFHAGPIPKEILMEAFWPGEDPETTRRNLYQAIYVLRQSLQTINPDHKYIITNNGSYLIDPDLKIWIDSDAFQQHLKKGQGFIEINQLENAISEYEAAISLYQEDLLPEDIYEDWLLLFREDLKNRYLDIINWLCRHYYNQKQYTFSINYARKIISQDHCREDAHRLLMKAYIKLGQRHLALKQYHQCETYLMDELDVQPMPATQSLYEEIS